jgi:hypothetical protein
VEDLGNEGSVNPKAELPHKLIQDRSEFWKNTIVFGSHLSSSASTACGTTR